MRLHFFLHVPFEKPAAILTWAHHRGALVSATRFFKGETPPSLDALDWLIVMGGPMNIYEEEQYPWLAEEKRFIRACIGGGKKVLGICLGAQLIADVLGGPVTRNPEKEIGWMDVLRRETPGQATAFDALPERFTALHWHGDTFAIPPGAVHLASSEACANQAFAYDGRVYGLQFHLESTQESVGELLVHCAGEIVPAPFIQSTEAIRAGAQEHADESNRMLFQFLDALAFA